METVAVVAWSCDALWTQTRTAVSRNFKRADQGLEGHKTGKQVCTGLNKVRPFGGRKEFEYELPVSAGVKPVIGSAQEIPVKRVGGIAVTVRVLATVVGDLEHFVD
jgi:hypothetical protein